MSTNVDFLKAVSEVRSYAGITDDSRMVKPGFVFVAIRGDRSDGHSFIPQVIRAGAVLIIGERDDIDTDSVPYVRHTDTREALALLAAAFHDNPSKSLILIGVTGTCGKTTSTYVIESILAAAGHKVGVIGTVEVRYPGSTQEASHTTPGAIELQDLLSRMRAAGCTAVVMEVSSHALKLKRVHGLLFDAMLFTNLSHEHLDLHGNMEDYFQTKALLFTEYVESAQRAGKHPVVVVNTGDDAGRRLHQMLLRNANRPDRLICFQLRGPAEVNGDALTFSSDGIRGKEAEIAVESQLVGRFNGENLLGAIGIARALGLSSDSIAEGIRNMRPVPGRLERVAPNGPHVFVDYAHKPGGLEVVLRTLQELRGRGVVRVVFGCGGDRDREKRPVMGEIAARLADEIWVTSDSPRSENPEAIIQEILAGIAESPRVHVEVDRKKAIEGAIGASDPDDLIVIAGKGHESFQIFGSADAPGGVRRVPFDDRQSALAALAGIRSRGS